MDKIKRTNWILKDVLSMIRMGYMTLYHLKAINQKQRTKLSNYLDKLVYGGLENGI